MKPETQSNIVFSGSCVLICAVALSFLTPGSYKKIYVCYIRADSCYIFRNQGLEILIK